MMSKICKIQEYDN